MVCIRHLLNPQPSAQIQILSFHVRQKSALRSRLAAALRVPDLQRPDKRRAGRKRDVAFVMKRKGEFRFLTQRYARLPLAAVQFQTGAGQQAAFLQVNHFTPLAGREIANKQTVFANVPGDAKQRMRCFGSRIIDEKVCTACSRQSRF